MKNNNLRISSIALLIAFTALAANALTIQQAIGWHETASAVWSPVRHAESYQVTYSGEGLQNVQVDDLLIRSYADTRRVDIPGLKPGVYTITVNAIGLNGEVFESSTTPEITVTPFVREGFAFSAGVVPGAYNLDGTPKENARILYITPENVNTTTLKVITDAKGKETESTGLCGILKNVNKGYDKRPLIIRIIGCIKDVTGLKSGNAVEMTGANFDKRATENITIEGIGNDAVCYKFGFFLKRSRGIEIRNLGVMLFPNDGISMEYDNRNHWIHHCDFFYGLPGKDADQSKGDGTIDMKYNSSDITIDHNHFWDSGKTTFAGGADESRPIYFTYHHNWFDHADSRCPRLCHASAHIYNNYFDANPTMCLLSTENSSAFVEANYFRNCPSPMEINMQGTNLKRWPDGEQNGGINKGYNNIYNGNYELITQHDNPTDFDVYVVDEPAQQIPSSVKSIKGENTYDNFDTSSLMYAYQADNPELVPEIVTQNAGRMQGGDFTWTFDPTTDDAHNSVNQPLKDALMAYDSSLLSVGPMEREGTLTGASSIIADDCGVLEIYNMSGTRIENQTNAPNPGVYIIKKGKAIKKVIIP